MFASGLPSAKQTLAYELSDGDRMKNHSSTHQSIGTLYHVVSLCYLVITPSPNLQVFAWHSAIRSQTLPLSS